MSTNAVFFEEGENSGYLLVKYLKKGGQGETMIVRSVADVKLYVRKRVTGLVAEGWLIDGQPQEVNADKRLGPSPPPYFPRLIESVMNPSSSECSMIFEYCNGGDLDDLVKNYGEAGKPIPEAVIWHILAELSKALSYLHYSRQPDGFTTPNWRPIFHNDLSSSNVFLHYPPNSDFLFPQVLIGDFGYATIPKNYDWSAPVPEDLCEVDHWSNDTGQIGLWLYRLLISHLKDPTGKYETWTEHAHPSYSEELKYWVKALIFDTDDPPPTALEMVQRILPRAESHISRTLEAGQDLSTSWRQPIRSNNPLLFPEYDLGDTPNITRPYEWVQVSPDDFAIQLRKQGANRVKLVDYERGDDWWMDSQVEMYLGNTL